MTIGSGSFIEESDLSDLKLTYCCRTIKIAVVLSLTITGPPQNVSFVTYFQDYTPLYVLAPI